MHNPIPHNAFSLTELSPLLCNVVSTFAFLTVKAIGTILEWLSMKRKTAVLATENDLLVDLTLHNLPASLLAEFAEKIVQPYYTGNLNAAIQDLIHKALSEQDFMHSHITYIKTTKSS